jgi:predicted transposase/invertase (TIGR01784 family)
VTLLNPFVDRDYAEGKLPVFDVRARDDPGRQFLLEMQRSVRASLAKRLLYYWASAHVEQLFKGQRYELLQPTYVICFLTEPVGTGKVYHHTFQLYDAEHDELLCKDLEIHLLELSKFAVAVEDVQTPLERWCYFFKQGASLDPANLPVTLDFPVIRQAVEVLMKISRDELERHRAAERLKGERDAADLLATARFDGHQQGFDEGIVKGREEGIEKGKVMGRIQLLQQLLQQPETSSEELQRLPEQSLLQLEESLKRQVSGTKRANGTPPTDKP